VWASEEEQAACRPQRWLVSRVQVRAHHDAAFKFHMQRRAEQQSTGYTAALHNFWSQLLPLEAKGYLADSAGRKV
jgi:hypothetical protein